MPDDAPRVLALLSHELRGPLGVIRGYLRLLSQSAPELSDRSRENVDAALRAADRLADVLDEASVFAHLRIGDLKLDSKQTPLSAIVGAAVRSVVPPTGSEIHVDLAALPPVTIAADEGRLQTALASLIALVSRANASTPAVEITGARALLSDVAAVELQIRPRAASEAVATVVELNADRGGFGLALPIAAVVVEGHGGRVRELRSGDRNAGIVVTLPIV